jgi:hypothetical protein
MNKILYYISLTLGATGLFLFIFALTFAYPKEVIPSTMWGIVCIGLSVWLSAWSEDNGKNV